jgi:hypothetical protein
LDASVGPSVDALLFFEHLLKPSLHAVREQLSAQRAQAQGLPRTYVQCEAPAAISLANPTSESRGSRSRSSRIVDGLMSR